MSEQKINDCYVIGNGGDYMVIMMGCGIGYFFLGYLITQWIYECRKKNLNEPILQAQQIL